MKRQLHLYWFSGSGNTLRMAEAFAERLRQKEWIVELRPLERSNPLAIDPASVLGLAFPTHFFTIPEIVLSFVRSLPRAIGTEAMMLGTHGALSGGVIGPLKRELTAKGFHCTAARIVRVPDSFYPIFSEAAHQRQLGRGLRKAERYADDFAAGRARWTRWAILSDIHAAIYGGLFAARKWTRYHTTTHVQSKHCNHCGICVHCCPANALKSETDSPLRPDKNCTNCLRCVAVCPTNAMRHLFFSPYRSEEAIALQHRFSNRTK
jgi:NAD-dependent dihydropyrimidine dehydrogenase PreA subunit